MVRMCAKGGMKEIQNEGPILNRHTTYALSPEFCFVQETRRTDGKNLRELPLW